MFLKFLCDDALLTISAMHNQFIGCMLVETDTFRIEASDGESGCTGSSGIRRRMLSTSRLLRR